MKRSTNVIVSNLSGDKILLSTFYTGPFLLFGKKLGGHGPPQPLPLLRHCPRTQFALLKTCSLFELLLSTGRLKNQTIFLLFFFRHIHSMSLRVLLSKKGSLINPLKLCMYLTLNILTFAALCHQIYLSSRKSFQSLIHKDVLGPTCLILLLCPIQTHVQSVL